MGRIRTIKPEFCSSPSANKLSRDARLFFLVLLTEVDDEGRVRYLRKKLAGTLFPEDDDVTPEMIGKWVVECESSKMIVTYRVDGDEYLAIVNFRKHQVVNKATPSKLPAPPSSDKPLQAQSVKPTNTLPEDYGSTIVGLPTGKGTGNREIGKGTGKSLSASAEPVTDPEPSKSKPIDWQTPWREFCQIYPSRVGGLEKPKAEEKFKALLKSGEDPGDILLGVENYRKHCDREGKTGTSYVKQMTTFLNGRCWLEDYTAIEPTRAKPRREMTTGERLTQGSRFFPGVTN